MVGASVDALDEVVSGVVVLDGGRMACGEAVVR